MTEKVVIGNAELWHGDCREILPGIQCDACVTDPPYGIGYLHGGGLGTRVWETKAGHCRAIHGDDAPFDPSPLLRFQSVFTFGADHYMQVLPPGGTMIAWDKHCGRGPADSFVDAEFIWTNVRGIKRNVLRYLWKGIACKKMGEENWRRYHPTMKPQGVMRMLLSMLPAGAGTVCDPYMGSGSTGVACTSMGLGFVGIEIDRRHFDTACERIAVAQAHGRMDFGTVDTR